MASTGTLGRLTVDLLLETLQWTAGLDKAEMSAQKFADAIEVKFKKMAANVGDQMKTLAAGVIAGLATEKVIGFIDTVQKSADALEELAQKSGTTTAFMAEMSVLAETSGTNINALASAMSKFNKATVEAATDKESSPAKVFDSLGISVLNANKEVKKSDELYKEAAAALGKMEDGAVKSALAMKLFGKSGADLIPLMNASARASDEMKASMKAYGDELSRLAPIAGALEEQQAIAATNSKTFAAILGEQLIPYITELYRQWNELSKAGSGLGTLMTVLLNVFKGIVIAIDLIVTAFRGLMIILVSLGEAFNLVKLGRFADAGKVVANTWNELGDTGTNLARRVEALVNPFDSVAESTFKTVKATQAQTDAAGKTAEALEREAKALAKLEREQEKARRAAEKAAREKKRWEDETDRMLKDAMNPMKKTDPIGDWAKQQTEKLTDNYEKFAKDVAEFRISSEKMVSDFIQKENKITAKYLEETWGSTFKSLESLGHQAFDSLFDGTKGGWKGMLDSMAKSFKKTLVDMVYQSFVKPLIVNLIAQAGGGLGQYAQGQLGAMGGGGGVGGMFSQFGSLLSSNNNTLISGFGAALGEFGAGMSLPMSAVGAGAIEAGVGVAAGSAAGAGAMAAAAIPYVGLAIFAAQLIWGKGGLLDEGPAMRKADFGGASSINAPGQSVSDKWKRTGALGQFGFSSGEWLGTDMEKDVGAFLDGIKQLDAGLAQFMTPEQVEKATKALDAASKQYSLGMEHTAVEFGKITKDRLTIIAKAVNEGLGAFVDSFEGPVEEIATIVSAYLQATRSRKTVSELVDASQPMSGMESYQKLSGTFTEFIAGLDVSGESLAALVTGMAAFEAATVAMVANIDAAANAMHDAFLSTAEKITRDLLDPEELYARIQSQTDELYAQLQGETDPAKIKALADKINSNINEAWGMLDEDQQSALGDEYLARIAKLDAAVAEKMKALREVVIEDAEGVMKAVADRLDVLFAKAEVTADKNDAAADKNLAAANTPVTVELVGAGPVNGG